MTVLKHISFAAGLLALPAFGTAPAHAQGTTSTTATASARVILPLTLTKTSDLAFGSIVKPSTGSATVTMTSGSNTVTVTGTNAASVTGLGTRAAFTIGGEGGQTFTLTVPASVSMTGPGTAISVTLASSHTSPVTFSGAIETAAQVFLTIGGSFSVPSTQTSGNYSGSFNITVTYN